MANAIETQALTKRFGGTRALDGIDLKIAEGTVYGLLGPNGAGKTTMIRVLSTLLVPDSGTATVLGHDVVREARTVRHKVSLTGQYASVDEDLTGHENLVLVARLLGFSWRAARLRAGELLEAFGLDEAARRQVLTYSGGMRRRIDIAASLVAVPEILFLDEPTTGLDPRSRNQVWELVRRIATEGTSSELKSSVGSNALHVRLLAAVQRDAVLATVSRVLGDGMLPATDPLEVVARVETSAQAAAVLQALATAGIDVASFSVSHPSLDEVFLALTGHPAEAAAEEAKS
jgi:ABC-2 type transport system ATP-binding protein